MDQTATTIKPERSVLLYVQSTEIAESTAGVLELLRRHASSEGLRVCGEFLDVLQPGKAPRRPGFEALMAEVRRGSIGSGVVVCRSIGELAPDIRQAVAVVSELLGRGVDIIAVAEKIDTRVADHGRLERLFRTLANLPRQAASERTRASLRRARVEGRPVGRPRVHVPVERARQLLTEGHSLRRTASLLRVAVATLHRALQVQPAASAPGFASPVAELPGLRRVA